MIQNYWIPCILMGVGIAIDVFIATMARLENRTMSARTWTLPIMGTHIAFPAVGYYSFWWLSEMFPGLDLILGLLGGVLVALFVYEVVCETVGVEPIFGISDWISGIVKLDETDVRNFIVVLAVSWDALWSGPAKSAQALAGHWTTNEVIFSFFVAGVVVAFIAQLALLVAYWLRRRRFSNARAMARFNMAGKFAELSVIGGFGTLSVWQGLTKDANLYASIVITASLLSVIFFRFRKEIMEKELADANAAIAH